MPEKVDIQVPLAELPSGDLEAIRELEQRLGDKYYLIAYRKTNSLS
ncbi:hypothetical protein [Desulforudis sp. DRI-14]